MNTNNSSTISVRTLVRIALMTALIAVCSWVTVPFFQVPFTLQTFAVFFALEFIGGKCGTVSFFLYIALGALGVPVFSGFAGGVGHLFGPTGGFLLGLAVGCVVYLMTDCGGGVKSVKHWTVLAVCLFVCYLFGTAWFVHQTGSGVGHALLVCVLPFIAPDIAKTVLAVFLSAKLKKIIKV